MLENSPSLLCLFLDGLVRLLYQHFKNKKIVRKTNDTSDNAASITADKANILDIKPGDKPRKIQLWSLIVQAVLTGLGFLPYTESRSQGLR